MAFEFVARNGVIALKDSVISGSLTVTGSSQITGSVNISGSTTQIGNNTLYGNTLLSGSVVISGSFPVGSYSSSVNIYGDTSMTGYLKFNPQSTNIDNNISASYIFVSGSTQDLYFTQNSAGYANTTRLRWLESNLYTGLLSGGVISASLGSTSFSVTSGSAIIVTLNSSTSSTDPYPTVKQVSWNTQTQPLLYSASAKITYVGIDNTGQIVQQTVPWGSINIDQFDTQVELGVVLHLSGSIVTGIYNTPQVSYGYAQQTDDFLRAFGPLKISGHTLSPSGSSPTLRIIKTGGTAYNKGANYVNNPNHPSTVIDLATNISKIYRYYISGSTPVIDTGIGGAGYTDIDNKNYVDTATGTLATVGNSNWSIQRVFWIPNSPTNAFLVYYGNARYGTLLNAVNAKDSEPFTEAPNTAQNAIFLGYIIIQGGGTGTPARDLNNSNETTIILGGLFRSINGIGSSGTAPVSNTLAGLADVAISSPTVGDLLVYGTGTQWNNNKALTGSYALTGSLTFLNGGITGSLFGTASNAVSASYATTASYVTPLSQSVIITGSLNLTGSQSILSGSLTINTGQIAGTSITTNTGITSNNSGFTSNGNGASTLFGRALTITSGAPFQVNAYSGGTNWSGSFLLTGSFNASGNITTAGTITAQTLVVQTVSSSIIYSSGSNIFGNKNTDNQVFTGSVYISGSILNVNTSTATFSSLGTGTVSATAGTLSTTSDMTLKIEDGYIDNALEKVLNLKPRYFHWKEESGLPTNIRQLGFYAQEVNAALGEETANTPRNETDKWGIYDRGIVAFLTKALQELNQKFEDYKSTHP